MPLAAVGAGVVVVACRIEEALLSRKVGSILAYCASCGLPFDAVHAWELTLKDAGAVCVGGVAKEASGANCS